MIFTRRRVGSPDLLAVIVATLDIIFTVISLSQYFLTTFNDIQLIYLTVNLPEVKYCNYQLFKTRRDNACKGDSSCCRRRYGYGDVHHHHYEYQI